MNLIREFTGETWSLRIFTMMQNIPNIILHPEDFFYEPLAISKIKNIVKKVGEQVDEVILNIEAEYYSSQLGYEYWLVKFAWRVCDRPFEFHRAIDARLLLEQDREAYGQYMASIIVSHIRSTFAMGTEQQCMSIDWSRFELSSGNCIGDITCQHNAKSQYLRCTINPSGPCEGCKDYEKA